MKGIGQYLCLFILQKIYLHSNNRVPKISKYLNDLEIAFISFLIKIFFMKIKKNSKLICI